MRACACLYVSVCLLSLCVGVCMILLLLFLSVPTVVPRPILLVSSLGLCVKGDGGRSAGCQSKH